MRLYLRLSGILWLLFSAPLHILGQKSCNQITLADHYHVHEIQVKGRWVPKSLLNQLEGIVGKGQVYDPLRVSAGMNFINEAFKKQEMTYPIELIGATSVLYIDVNSCPVGDSSLHLIDVIYRPYFIRVDLFRVGKSILPIPRGAKATFYEAVPHWLLALGPEVSFSQDRIYGPAVSAAFSSDLLHLPKSLQQKSGAKKVKLRFSLAGRKSFSQPYGDIQEGIELLRNLYQEDKWGWSLGVSGAQSNMPLTGDLLKQSRYLSYVTFFEKVNHAFLYRIQFNAGYHLASWTYQKADNVLLSNKEQALLASIGLDGKLAHGISRLGLWFDDNRPSESAASAYQRLAGRFSFFTPLGKGHQSVDLEASFGGAISWGSVPVYQQFYAGNASANYLYETLGGNHPLNLPAGPLVRALGDWEGALSNQVLPQGGNSFAHVNFNILLPIAKWSRPLIPNIIVNDDPLTTLPTALKGMLVTTQSFIQDDLMTNGGFTNADSADAVAQKIVDRDIGPTVNYLADRANAFSIKPMLLFDLAELRSTSSRHTWVAVGPGLHISLVNAGFEGGYMHTLGDPSMYHRGNFFVRLVFQNFY